MADFQASQLSLSIGLRDDATFANFFPGDNIYLLEALCSLLESGGETFQYIYGPQDSGKSHLLQALCHQADALGFRSVYLPLDELALLSPELLEGLETLDLVCIDDLHLVAGRAKWEAALFHCFNRLRDAGKVLVISADAPPSKLGVKLPDLSSRLAWGITSALHKLDDEQKIMAFKLRAHERGLELTDEVARYILHRSPRSLRELFDMLSVLDHASLMAQRKLTIPFVKETLRW
ncbi:DnaA regulatory inactivator Hda [Oceanospirillum linum]|uniref:DnaA regulatory inactivator Hda n=1 Tax=Oceanospirillum linum TaxID=966 RepID=A0A1T1HD67_OCELI|nr:DnaA regulatory inactivator Hda [Oceanospirillum linum]OOV87752.1 DnaA regulatory inactivator Hda [Oceanospirillum linum]SEG13458.1 regulatory inactivation of DnaA Hda protein [Oleiphilus messinensis]SMP10323.1 regulatory inactivation of DnaA Hda protein [Oceanospirillum linum]